MPRAIEQAPRFMSRALAIAILAFVVMAASVVDAAPTEGDLSVASKHFQRGKAAFDRKDYEAAALAFDEAFATVPDAGTAFNAALAWERAKDSARAADSYVQAIETGGLDAPRSADAKRALRRLEAKLPRVTVRTTSPARVTIAYREGPAPVVAHVAAGRYDVVAVFEDGSRTSLSIEVGRSPVVAELRPSVPAVREPVALAPPVVVVPESSSDPGAVQRVIGFVGLGLGAASGGTAIALGVLGLEARDEFEATGRRDRELHDEASSLRIGTNIAWGIAGAFAVTGIVLVATSFGSDDAEEAPATAALCAGPTRLALCGSF